MPGFRCALTPSSLLNRGFLKAAFTLGLVASTCAGPALGRHGAEAQQNSSSPVLGTWSNAEPLTAGGTNYQFHQYNADGSFRWTAIVQGGSTTGLRTQLWGHYTVQRMQGNSYQISIQPAGHVPTQTCAPGMGCKPFPLRQPESFAVNLDDNNHMSLQNGSWERVAQIPQQLASRAATTYNLPAPPPVAATGGGYTPNGGGTTPSATSTYHVPGQGTCDDLQQQRVCTINDGYMYTGRDGCQHCSK